MQEYHTLIDGRRLRLWNLDFETQSECNLRDCGAYVYAEHPTTKVLMCALKTGPQKFFWTPHPMNLVMPAGVEYVNGIEFLREVVTDPEGCCFTAHNMEFEKAMWLYCLRLPEPTAWRDTMDIALSRGLPGAADKAGEYLFGMGKDKLGYALMMSVCKPDRKGVMPQVTDRVVQGMINYNFVDVQISEGIADLEGIEAQTLEEQQVCDVHHIINTRGVRLDQDFARNLQCLDEHFKTQARERVAEVTGGALLGEDLTRVDYLRRVLNEQLPREYQLDNMRISTIQSLVDLKEPEDGSMPEEGIDEQISDEVIEVLKSRLIVSRAAMSKVDAAFTMLNNDGRMRGLLRYWGAGTGRWCLAGDTEVLTCLGGVVAWAPITDVTLNHLVWDGDDWVQHEGVVCHGEKEVIEYNGLTATPDHLVYVDAAKALPLQDARTGQLRLWQGNHLPDCIPQRKELCGAHVSGIEGEMARSQVSVETQQAVSVA